MIALLSQSNALYALCLDLISMPHHLILWVSHLRPGFDVVVGHVQRLEVRELRKPVEGRYLVVAYPQLLETFKVL